jgi:DNA-binding XRE family transcriptional regulator
MSGYVYAIGIEGTALVKIGHALDVAKRLSALQIGLPYRLVVLHQEQVEQPRHVEKALHRMLNVIRERGEWFELPEVYFPSLFAQGIAKAELQGQEKSLSEEVNTLRQELRRIRRAKDLTQQELALLAGVNYTTISRIESGEAKQVYWETAVKLAKALKVSLDDFAPMGPEPLAKTQKR